MGGKRWTMEEEEILEAQWGIKSVEDISEKLNRTRSSIINHARYMGLGRAYDSGLYLFVGQVSDILGYSPSVIHNWIKKEKLPAKKRVLIEAERYFIVKDSLIEWLRKNQHLWNSNNLEINAFGTKVEKEWLKEKRRKDIRKKKKGKLYTKSELEVYLAEYNKGTSYSKIGLLLGRTRNSVKEKARDLRRRNIIERRR